MRASLACALVLSLVGCSGCSEPDSAHFGTTSRKGKDPKTLYTNLGSEPEYLDPGMSNDSSSSWLCHQLFEGLTVYGQGDLRPTQGVAERWERSADNRLYRFHLRRSAAWSDGKPVTAHDFEYAWKRVLRPSLASRGAPHLYPLVNGELYNQDKLKLTRENAALVSAPRGGAELRRLPAGVALRVVITSPVKPVTSLRPRLAPVPGATKVEFAKGVGGKPDVIAWRGAGGPVTAADEPGAGVATQPLDVVGRGAPIECNGAQDHWFEVRGAGVERGFLPGCMLEPDAAWQVALVAPHARIPTFVAKPEAAPEALTAPEPASPEPLGFVAKADLADGGALVGVRAKGDHVLEVELELPTPYFLDLTSDPNLFPVRRDVIEPFEKRGEPELWFRPENLVSNGPYVLDEWRFRYEISLRKNKSYWDRDNVTLERVVFANIDAAHSSMNLYKAGDFDYYGDSTALPTEYLSRLSKYGDYRTFEYLSTYWYEFNVAKPPVNDVRVRRALNLAVDKQQIVEKIARGGQKPATHYVPELTGLGYSEAVKADKAAGTDPFAAKDLQFDPERGRALLAEAGYPVERAGEEWRAKGFPQLEILYNTSEGHKQIAIAIQDMWKRHLGISATIRNEEWKVMLKNVRDGFFQVVRFGWVADYNHPQTWLETFTTTSPQNRTGWSSPEFDQLLKKAAATPDPKASMKLFREAERLAVDGMAKLPIYFYTRSTLVKPYVGGFVPNGRNTTLMKWLAIDPDWAKKGKAESPYKPLEFEKPGLY